MPRYCSLEATCRAILHAVSSLMPEARRPSMNVFTSPAMVVDEQASFHYSRKCGVERCIPWKVWPHFHPNAKDWISFAGLL
jgi:hypothetical protein